MQKIFESSDSNGYRHYFYGSTEETLKKLRDKLQEKYPNINIVGMYSPPFRTLTEEEDNEIIKNINNTEADIVWVGLGAPKQEIWMNNHKNKIKGLMIGVGAGFDYHAGNIKRAPKWMQKCSLEWLYRLLQDPKRLFKRYFRTNTKFIKLVHKELKNEKSLNILLVHNFYQNSGGEDSVFFNEYNMLMNAGHNVIKYTEDNSDIKK